MPFGSRFGRVGQWWKDRSSLEQILIIFAFIGIIIIIILSTRPYCQTKSEEKVCNTPECIKEAGLMLSKLNTNVKYCKGLFPISCHKIFKKENLHILEIPMLFSEELLLDMFNEPINDSEHKLVKITKKFFQVCLNQSEIEQNQVKVLKEIFNKVGGWPILEGDTWNEASFDWINSTYKLRNLGYEFSMYLNIAPVTDPENENKTILMLSIPDISPLDNNTLRQLHQIFDLGDINKIYLQFSEARNFSLELQKVNLVRQRDIIDEKEYQRLTVEKYQETLNNKNIQLLEFINNIIGPLEKISKDEVFLFPPTNNFTNWLDLISKTPKRIQANYMIWKVIEKVLPYLIKQEDKIEDIWTNLKREEYCLNEIYQQVPMDSIILMINRRYVSFERKKQLEELLQNIKLEFLDILKKLYWMDEKDKHQVIENAESIKIKAVPDNYFDDKLLDNFIVDLTKEEDFFSLIAQANRNQVSMKFRIRTDSEPLDSSWVNSLEGFPNYIKKQNTLIVPAATIKKWLFDEKRPSYLNYGSIGYMVGNQLTEIVALNYVKWSNKTEEAFLNKMECLEKKLESLKFNYRVDHMLQGIQLTIGELVSYKAYEKQMQKNGEELKLIAVPFTPKQLFWISVASTSCKSFEHLPTLAIYSYNNFANDFNCPVIQNPNYLEACHIL